MKVFKDRKTAGELLAKKMNGYKDRTDVILLALSTGSIPVAYEIARNLNVLFDVFFIIDIPLPGQEKFSLGTVTSGEIKFINTEVVHGLRVPDQVINIAYFNSLYELKKKDFHFRAGMPAPELKNKRVIIVTDGSETDKLLKAGIMAVKSLNPTDVVLASPVINQLSYEYLRQEADSVISLYVSENNIVPEDWYKDFSEVEDKEAIEMLRDIKSYLVSGSRSIF